LDASSSQNSGAAEPMRICVIGCGAVGSLFAAHLGQLDDVETWAYDVSPEHVDAINRNGLRLTGTGEVTGRVRATTDADELPPCRFGIIATKALHTKHAMILAGLGWGNLPEHLVRGELETSKLVALRLDDEERTLALWAVYKKETALGPAHRWWLAKLPVYCERDAPPVIEEARKQKGTAKSARSRLARK